MPRDDAFGRADIDVGLFDDLKIKRLWRLLKDPAKMHHALTLYVSAILASWRDGKPVSVSDAAPLWTDAPDEIVAALNAVGLLDEKGRIPDESFAHWFGPASERKARRKTASDVANAARWGKNNPNGSPIGVRNGSDAAPQQTDRHTSGPAPATPEGGRARERTDGETLKQYLTRIGAPIPFEETKNGETNGTQSGSNDDGKSRSRTRRRKAPTE